MTERRHTRRNDPVVATVHLLVEADGGKGTIRSGCGVEERKRVADPMPDTFTGWASQVTCSACLRRSR